MLYLDNNSTTLILPEVVETMRQCWEAGYFNPASQHQGGREARQRLATAKNTISRSLHLSNKSGHADQLIITSGGTEANNLAVRGLVQQPGHVLISCIEHPSVLAAAEQLALMGCVVESIPVSSGCHVEPGEVAARLRDDTRLVCVMYGNNETGTLQPVSQIALLCRERGIPLHTDAVQVAGKLAINFQELGVTSLSLAGHKFHGPAGVGGLVLRHDASIKPLLVGGSQQLGIRPGTEPVALVAGLATALQLADADTEAATRMSRLRDQLESNLVAHTHCVVNGDEPRLPHTTNVSFEGIDRQALLMALDLAGIACSTGSACTSGSSEPSHVLLGMGCPNSVVEGSIRFSLSRLSSQAEIDLAVLRISAVVDDLRHR